MMLTTYNALNTKVLKAIFEDAIERNKRGLLALGLGEFHDIQISCTRNISDPLDLTVQINLSFTAVL